MAKFHLLKIRTIIDIFKNEKCKVTFGLEYNIVEIENIIEQMLLMLKILKLSLKCQGL